MGRHTRLGVSSTRTQLTKGFSRRWRRFSAKSPTDRCKDLKNGTNGAFGGDLLEQASVSLVCITFMPDAAARSSQIRLKRQTHREVGTQSQGSRRRDSSAASSRTEAPVFSSPNVTVA